MVKDVKLFLYSMEVSDEQFSHLDKLVGKENRADIKFAIIKNATDIIPNSDEWVPSIIQTIKDFGYSVNIIDLKTNENNLENLNEQFSNSDVIWVCGGHTFYLAWILKQSGADNIIIKQIKKGKVYAGWSAGAIIAGPTTRYFELMGDDPNEVTEIIEKGLGLTDYVIVPHMDNYEFKKSASKTNEKLMEDGFRTIPLNDNQVVVIYGENKQIIEENGNEA